MTTPTPGDANLGGLMSPEDQAAIQALIAQETAGSGGKARTPVPFRGRTFSSPNQADRYDAQMVAGGSVLGPGDGNTILRDADDVFRDALRMTDPEIDQVAKRMISVGLLDDAFTRTDFEKAWGTLVGLSAEWHAANPTSLLTPEDMLDLYYGTGGAAAIGSAATPGTPLQSVRSVTSTRTQLATNDDARALLANIMTRELGRRPTEQEIDDFQASLNQAQTANPYSTTTTTNYGADGRETGSNSVTSGGVDASGYANRYADETIDRDLDSEYGQYQAAAQFMPALMQALSGPVR